MRRELNNSKELAIAETPTTSFRKHSRDARNVENTTIAEGMSTTVGTEEATAGLQ
jgi:hypothetical protein